MKKILFILIAGLTFGITQSQVISDALRYSQENLNGTARFRALSGAFGALGGDLSSINVNPAGSAIFSNNQLAVTLSNFDIQNNSNYFGSRATEKNNSLDLNQAGVVFVFKNYDLKSDWKKFSLAINYENANNFDNDIFAFGTNPTNSVGDYFLSYANANPSKNQPGIPLGVIKDYNYFELNFADQQAFLGYEGYLINPVEDTDNNTVYTSNVPAGGNYTQQNTISSSGYNGKLSFNAATSYKDQIYLGLNLNSHFVDFRQHTFFTERNDNANNNPTDLVSTAFENEIYTYGSGFSFQIGSIFKVSKEVRLGLAYQSPTWYKLNDELRQYLYSTGYNFGNPPNPSLSVTDIDSNEFVVYETHKLRTPGKLTGSFAYIFGKKGLISIDYALKNYDNASYTIQNNIRDPFINTELSSNLKNTGELRFGAEYKIERLSLRGGYRYEQSPYKNTTTIGDLKGYSAGLGYNFGSTKADLSYAYSKRNSQQGFFSQGFTDGARVNTETNTVTFSLLFEL